MVHDTVDKVSIKKEDLHKAPTHLWVGFVSSECNLLP